MANQLNIFYKSDDNSIDYEEDDQDNLFFELINCYRKLENDIDYE